MGSNVSTEHNTSKFREEGSSYDTENIVCFLTGTRDLSFSKTSRLGLRPT